MDLVTGESIPRRERGDLRHDIALQSGAAIELRTALVEGAQELGNESTDRGARLRRLDPGRPVDVVRDGDGQVLHRNTVTQKHRNPGWDCSPPRDPRRAPVFSYLGSIRV
jgi:hypothetical protein